MESVDQLEIGGVFEFGGVKYKVIETTIGSCEDCCFIEMCNEFKNLDERPYCSQSMREDEKSVIFVRVD